VGVRVRGCGPRGEWENIGHGGQIQRRYHDGDLHGLGLIHACKDGSHEDDLYVGYRVPLSAAQLYGLKVTGYWHSCANVPDVAVRGYQMTQEPPRQPVGGRHPVDVGVVKRDAKGDVPHWLIDDVAELAAA
jgi:hypothetical protein